MPEPQVYKNCGNGCFTLCNAETEALKNSTPRTVFVPNNVDEGVVVDARDLLENLSAELITVQDKRREYFQAVVPRLIVEFDRLSGTCRELQDANDKLTPPQKVEAKACGIISLYDRTDSEGLGPELIEKLKSEVVILQQELGQVKRENMQLREECMVQRKSVPSIVEETNGRSDYLAYTKLGDDSSSNGRKNSSRPNSSQRIAGTASASLGNFGSTVLHINSEIDVRRRSSSSAKTSRRSSGSRALDTKIKSCFAKTPWKVCQVITLAFALFGGGMWTMFDVSEDPGTLILDILMLITTLFFVVDLVGQWLVEENYRYSFFFWMDVLGTLSMLFEISFLLGNLANVDTVVFRIARTAKLGGRVGRLLKLLKFILKKPDLSEISKAKILSQNLLWALSTRVSILTIVLVMVFPIFSIPLFPTEDLSLKLWPQRLEDMYSWDIAPTASTMYATTIAALTEFYQDQDYFPYQLEGYTSALSSQGVQLGHDHSEHLSGRTQPNRKANRLEQEVTFCRVNRGACDGGEKASIHFDMTTPNRIEAAMNMSLIVFIVLLMVYVTFDLNRIIDSMLVEPLERMIQTVRIHASDLCAKIMDVYADMDDDDRVHVGEIEFLEHVLKKLVRLASVHLAKNAVREVDMGALDAAGKAVLVDLMNVKIIPAVRPTPQLPRSGRASMQRRGIHTWDFNVLDFTSEQRKDVVTHLFFTSELGYADDFVDMETFSIFYDTIQAGYNDVPYHSFSHAVDVLHGIFRVLHKIESKEWLTPVEQYALLVAAVSHDIGHFGKTNPFLVETGHELALRYNDKSPLENMHCATLYEICSAEKTDIFSKASSDSRKNSRKVCIEAILHTDNAHHFQMVQNICHIYEVHDNTCEQQAEAGEHFTAEYLSEVLVKERQTWLQILLHLVDVANPAKPFPICEAWAKRALAEFFAQGDEEKRLGIPVGMLNDRVTVNQPGSQHGFINFLVAPLLAGAVNLFPVLADMHHQMALNLEKWRDIWIEESSPSPEDIAKKDVDVKRIKDLDLRLQSRLGVPEFLA